MEHRRVIKRPLWKRSDIDPTKECVLLLVEDDDGNREFELREFAKKDDLVKEARRIHTTAKIPLDLVISRCVVSIAENVVLESGEGFMFNSNGAWLTLNEFEAYKKEFFARRESEFWLMRLLSRLHSKFLRKFCKSRGCQ
ncbi:hypothetical protein FNU76_19115 [Chitinimonas arctica]|uniref:Uncharacterized protein n=1 Tax=Chitinimonas arctica TaxID=2594795 RepID=A0A516SJF2_9NEIS|nr:hypothetical protein [Chitinimonas arctica]QDQ28289.1 hypothetical protein FNU76_19115 [Chitinimonas arctica]